MEALKVEKLYKNFGGLQAINGISLKVEEGERRAIIGPNGAGKTTLFNLISGELKPSAGHVFLHDQEITGLQPYQIAAKGLARTFQRNNLFLGLSVFENVRIAAQQKNGISSKLLSPASSFRDVNAETAEILETLALGDKADILTKNLSYGEQRQVEIAIALATRPKVLLLDEPCAGLSPAETTMLTGMIKRMPNDITILIIEHDMDVVFALADRIAVLHYGEVLAEGTPQEVKANKVVLEVYLGEEVSNART
ncbi:MAG: ABC transporter ATP-binding protein [Dehalococcoidales bacterium]|nr:ABC transporter ATP-binding protein [Dehalococcoidales bacterium]